MIGIEGLSMRIGDTPILEDVTLTLPAGRITGLVGESGSGKSMTALAIMRLLPRSAAMTGRIALDDTQLMTLSERQMCAIRGDAIGMIFQEPMTSLNPVQTIGAQITETLRLHRSMGAARAAGIAREKLDRVGLEAVPLSRYPHELSGGQRQRVAIAMAIALRPRLLIADEPTTALDVTTQAQILDLLGDLVADEGMALLLITHDLAVVAGLADQVAVMQEGRIVEQGTTADVFRQMRHPYTRLLFEASDHQPDRAGRRTSAPLLRVEGATRTYRRPLQGLTRPPDFTAVDAVSFTLHHGESLGLVGESGCGKSTLTRAILGLDTVQGGAITLDGTPVRAGDPRMQVVFQDPYGSFNPRHRVARLITEPFHATGTPPDLPDRIAEALEAVQLRPADAQKYIHEFSGGQRQRVAIARALITKPKLILLDEAVSALDVRVRAQILDLLADLQDRFGLSYLFISHDLTVVRAITDRVLVMQAGRIVEDGPTERVFAAPSHPYTRRLLDAAPRLELAS